MNNLVAIQKYGKILLDMRKVCDKMVKAARGTGEPKVLRYTEESNAERNAKLSEEKKQEKAIIKDDH